MTQGKLLELLEDIGISMSAGYLSNLLIKNYDDFESEFNEVKVTFHHWEQSLEINL